MLHPNKDVGATIASGSYCCSAMVILPCSTDMLARVAGGLADTLISRAAHCHLKEHRKCVLCVRENPWSLIDLDNARRVAAAGGIVMPLSPPFYQTGARGPREVSMSDLLAAYVDRVLAVLGHPADTHWGTLS